MATKDVWEKLRHFRPDSKIDNFGDVDAISGELLFMLDDFRNFLGVPVIVLRGVSPKGMHSKNSYHYIESGACAVDVAIPEFAGTPIDLLISAFRFPFSGVGFYPDWTYQGKQAKGLHLDTRPFRWDADETKNYTYNRWIGVATQGGSQKYIAMSWQNIDETTGGNRWNS